MSFDQAWWVFWYGVFLPLGVAAAMIFWSHYWRRQPQRFPILVRFLGHLIYFVIAFVSMSFGVFVIVGLSLGGGRQMVGMILPSILVGFVITTIAMMLPTRRASTRP